MSRPLSSRSASLGSLATKLPSRLRGCANESDCHYRVAGFMQLLAADEALGCDQKRAATQLTLRP